VKHYFLQRFSNFNFRKKKEKKRDEKKRNKEGKAQFVINYCTSSREPNNSTCFLPFGREISDMILIIRRNISSNGYNQYY